MPIRALLSTVAAILALTCSAFGGEVLALNGLDPVELSLGRQVRGKPSYSLNYGPFRYEFVSWESLEQFEWNPAIYEVQYGGACATAGPNGPAGDQSQFASHQGRTYTFADSASRERFTRNPDAYIEKPDPVPSGDAASAAKGKSLIQKAVDGFGGAQMLARLRTYASTVQSSAGSQGAPGPMTQTFTSFPATVRQEYVRDSRPETREVRVINGTHGFLPGPDGRVLQTVEIDGLRNDLFRDPLFLVKARHRGDFRAFASGTGTVSGTAVEYVNAHAGGVTVKLGIDPTNGRILSATYRDRTAEGQIGEIVRTYSNFTTVDGLTVPLAFAQTEDGKASPAANSTVSDVQVNPSVPNGHFSDGRN